MIPEQWSSPCGKQCNKKYAALMQIPWRVFCKKGCDTDGETWDECLEECDEICYKDPVFKDQQWSSYFDRSPGAENCSLDCFRACISGCGYKFNVPSATTEQVKPNRPTKPELPIVTKPPSLPPVDDLPGTSA